MEVYIRRLWHRAAAPAITVAAVVSALLAPAAWGHGGDPRYLSIVHGLTPAVPGLTIRAVGNVNELQLTNHTRGTVTVPGYDGEQYARLLPDGTVEVNLNSPAYYLNQDQLATTPIPSFATDSAKPNWKVLDKTGRFTWHDHRMHWMGKGVPPAVKDQSKRTTVFNYSIPIKAGSQPIRATGTLFWTPTSKGNTAVIVGSLIGVLLLSLVFVVVVRRRRRQAEGVPTSEGSAAREAW